MLTENSANGDFHVLTLYKAVEAVYAGRRAGRQDGGGGGKKERCAIVRNGSAHA
jgi:hypothetical protein